MPWNQITPIEEIIRSAMGTSKLIVTYYVTSAADSGVSLKSSLMRAQFVTASNRTLVIQPETLRTARFLHRRSHGRHSYEKISVSVRLRRDKRPQIVRQGEIRLRPD